MRISLPSAALALTLLAAACADSPRAPDAGPEEKPADAAPSPVDAQTNAGHDASTPAIDAHASGGDGGGACSFNRDCLASERCACSESSGCRCEPGARGTGRPGLDSCSSGDDCESALCIEGPTGALLCSAPCDAPAECPPALPRCLSVAPIGSFCARNPPGADAGMSPDAGTAGCAGACATTTLVASFGGRNGAFDRAQHGRSGTDGLHVEAHLGGDPACPTESSPTPYRTLVIAGLRALPNQQTESDGLRATLLDFRGDLTSAPLLRATSVRATPRFLDRGGAVSFELTATFAEGTISGGLFAPHCDSLDGP